MATKIQKIGFESDNKIDVKEKTQESVKQTYILHDITYKGRSKSVFFFRKVIWQSDTHL